MDMSDNVDTRLSRIESKIDQLSDAMITLARAEEKLIAVERANSTMYDRLNRHSEKIDEMNLSIEKNKTDISFLLKFQWFILTSIIISQLVQWFPKQ
jgi:hypothetical protein